MITKQITKTEVHFDNKDEREHIRKEYENNGYKIIEYGYGIDWYFVCEKVN